MKYYVTVRAGNADNFTKGSLLSGEREIIVPLDQTTSKQLIRNNLWQILDSARLSPSDRCVDLLRAAIAVYSADLRIERRNAFDGWTREIILNLPVSDLSLWSAARTKLQALLRFLTGDRWNVNIRLQSQNRPARDQKLWNKGVSTEADVVSLFSGGLDSFIGAIELTADLTDLCLVGHYDEGATSDTQSSLIRCFRGSRNRLVLPFLKFFVQPPTNLTGEHEPSKRSRSLLFLALGTAVAVTLRQPGRLVVSENGFIGVNAPLTITRLGSLSTRTTHPYTLQLYRELMSALQIDVNVETPYAFITKGEMISRVIGDEAFKQCYKTTLSCAHPQATRWLGRKPNTHCGYCVPCIIRRAAFSATGLDPADIYALNILNQPPEKGQSYDLRAFLIAIGMTQRTHAVPAVLSSGPISSDPTLIARYADMYERGLNEVNSFLAKKRWRRFR